MSVQLTSGVQPPTIFNQVSFIPQPSNTIQIPRPSGRYIPTVDEYREFWKNRALAPFSRFETFLVTSVPNCKIQFKMDSIGQYIENLLSPLDRFSSWLDNNGQGNWFEKLAICLAKTPLRVARNIVRLLYQIVKAAFYSLVHPLQALNKLAKLLVTLAFELTKSETWSKIGGGIMGASLGYSLVGNPFSVVTLAVGAALSGFGITVGALAAALDAERGVRFQAAKENFCLQMENILESFATNFALGAITGSIYKATHKQDPQPSKEMQPNHDLQQVTESPPWKYSYGEMYRLTHANLNTPPVAPPFVGGPTFTPSYEHLWQGM